MKPTPKEIVQNMQHKFGEGMPKSVKILETLKPEMLYTQINSSADSMSDPDSPFEPKYRTLLYLSAALASNNESCIKAQFHAAMHQGATKEEILAVVKIVRHQASSGVLGRAEIILEGLS